MILSYFLTVTKRSLRCHLTPLPVLLGCKTRLTLEEVVECWRIGKMETLGYLVGQQVAGAQQDLGAQHDGTVYPVHHAMAAGTCDDCREVMGRDVELGGIEGYVAFSLAMAAHQHLELLEQLLVARDDSPVRSVAGGLLDRLHVSYHRPDHRQYGIATEG